MFGAMIVGIVSDKLFSSKRNPVYLLCGALHTTCFFILGFLDEKEHAIAASILLCFGGIWLLGGFSLVSFSSTLDLTEQNNASNNANNASNNTTASNSEENNDGGKILYVPVDDEKLTKTPKKKDASSSVAFFACMLSFFQYMGSGLSGIIGAKVIGAFGFSIWCFMLSGVCLATVLPVLLLDDYVINILKKIITSSNKQSTTTTTTTTKQVVITEERDNLVERN
jgi:sugar phosphate permease